MPRVLSDNLATQVEKQNKTAPLIILRLDWGTGVEYYAGQEIVIDEAEDIKSLPLLTEFSSLNSSARLGDKGALSSISFTLTEDKNGSIKQKVNESVIQGTAMTVYQHYFDIDFADALILFSGFIGSDITWSESEQSLNLASDPKVVDDIVKAVITREELENAGITEINEDALGESAPFRFGKTFRVPAVHYRRIPRSEIRGQDGTRDIFSVDSTKGFDLFDPTQFGVEANAFSILRNGSPDKFFFLPENVAVNASNASEQPNFTAPEEPTKPDIFLIDRDSTDPFYKDFRYWWINIDGAFPNNLTSSTLHWRPWANRAPAFSNKIIDHNGFRIKLDFPPRWLGQKSNEELADSYNKGADEFEQWFTQFVLEDIQQEIQSASLTTLQQWLTPTANLNESLTLTEENLPGVGTVFSGTWDHTTTKVTLTHKNSFISGTGSFGDLLLSAVATDDEYLVSAFPHNTSEFIQVYAKRQIGETVTVEPVDSSFYTTVNKDVLPSLWPNQTVLVFSESLLDKVDGGGDSEGWTEEVFCSLNPPLHVHKVGGTFEEINTQNPAEVLAWVLENYSQLLVNKDSFYTDTLLPLAAETPCNFALIDDFTAVSLAEEIAWQSRMAMLTQGNIINLRYLAANPEALVGAANIRTMTDDNISMKTEILTFPDNIELLTKTKFKFRFTQSGVEEDAFGADQFFIFENNIEQFGIKEKEFELFIYTGVSSKATIEKVARWWGYRYSNSWRKFEFTAFLNALREEVFDSVFINLSAVSENQLKGFIQQTDYDPKGPTIKLIGTLNSKTGEVSGENKQPSEDADFYRGTSSQGTGVFEEIVGDFSGKELSVFEINGF